MQEKAVSDTEVSSKSESNINIYDLFMIIWSYDDGDGGDGDGSDHAGVSSSPAGRRRSPRLDGNLAPLSRCTHGFVLKL